MFIQLTTLLFAAMLSTVAIAGPSEKEIKDLFSRYEQIVQGEKSVKAQDVFSSSFLQEAGGEKSLAGSFEKEKPQKWDLHIKPSRRDQNRAYVERVPAGSKQKSHSSFIVVKEKGQWLIEGTISDDE